MTELKFQLVITHLDHNKAGEVYEGFAAQETDADEISGGTIWRALPERQRHNSNSTGPIFIPTSLNKYPLLSTAGAKWEYEGAGLVRLERGSMVIAPPDIKHTFVRCSEDFVVVEMSAPSGINVVPVED